MNRIAYTTALLVLSISVAFFSVSAAQEHQHDMKMKADESGKQVTLVGEVLDLYCYMMHPASGQGPDHAKCAQTCISKGLPIGFLSDGKVYLILGKDHESAKDLVVGFAGKQARLTGTLVEHDGVNAIEISKIEAASAASGK